MVKKFEEFNMINESKVVSFKKSNGNFVVMTGAPGSGKSTVSSSFVNLPIINILMLICIVKEWLNN